MKGKNTSQMISAGKFWMRAYHRGDKTCYLCNFCPTGKNGLLPKLEHLLDIEEVAMFPEVEMAFIVTNKVKGVPVYDLSEFLNKIAVES
ncbi:MAG: hypothetical protein IJ762_04145 [Bacteroidaceae bacterium]|nr:hypothetical protein [Bacteroidaceae bacterium]MBR1788368.1 hypothetical protein [Bacteroidaceae bacterium]